jgi:hypothetical protein
VLSYNKYYQYSSSSVGFALRIQRSVGVKSDDDSESQPTTWVQDRFVTSFWVDPIVQPSEFDHRYAEIAAANFTLVISTYAGLDQASQMAKLAACEKYGLKFLASPCRKTPVWSGKAGSPLCADNVSTISVSSPALWGWKVADEPPAVSLGDANPANRPGLNFSTLASWNRRVALQRPEKLRFVNLLQNYAGPLYWGVPTYAEYLQRYISTVKPQLLSFDHYPRFYDNNSLNPNITKTGFRRQLGVMRAIAQKANIPFWSIIRCIGIDFGGTLGNQYDVTESQLRWQAYTALAYGTAGIVYFTYWPTDAFKGQGMVLSAGDGTHPEYRVGPHYYEAQRINSVLRIFGGRLLHAQSTGVLLLPQPFS